MKEITIKQRPDFSGQKLFIGIDVHQRSWVVTIRTKDIELRTFSMNPVPKELAKHLKTNYPNAEYFSVYEAGFSGFWAHRDLINLGINSIIVNPSDVPTTQKEKDQKRDVIDSRKLARELASSSLKNIYIPTKEQEAIRALSRLRFQIVKRKTQIKNRIKQFLYTRGINLPERSEMNHWSHRFIHWLETVELSQKQDQR